MRRASDDDEDDEDDSLEVVPVGKAVGPPALPGLARRMSRWGRRHRWALVAGAGVAVLFAVAYAAVAVRGLRSLEENARSALALRQEYDRFVADIRPARPRSYRILAGEDHETRIRRATVEYGARVAELAARSEDVTVIDPSLRRLRGRIVAYLRDEANRSKAAARTATPWLGRARAAETRRLVDASLRRWRRPPGRAPRPEPLPAVSEARRSTPLMDDPPDVRLFLVAREGVLEVELDSGLVHLHGDGGGSRWAVGDGFLAVVEDGRGVLRPFGGRARPRLLGRYDLVVRDADDSDVAWFVTAPDGTFDAGSPTALAFDRRGTQRGRVDVRDGTVVAVSASWVVRVRYGVGTDLVVDDRRSGRELGVLPSAQFHALWHDRLAYDDGTGKLLVRDLKTGEEWTVPSPPGTVRPTSVTVSPDRSRLAVVWRLEGDGAQSATAVAVHDAASLHPIAAVPTGADRVHVDPAWSRSSRWLFFVLQGDPMGVRRVLAWHEGWAEPKPVLVEGEFHGVLAF